MSASRRACWLLILIIAASFTLRMHDLEAKSLWSDEGLTLRRAEQPLHLIFENLNLIPTAPDYHDGTVGEGEVVLTPDLHPPLYFLLMHGWIRVAGESEFALRFPSVVGATLALPLLYVLARRLLSREAGLWAVLLAALSPFYLWYAQEARMYTWLVTLSLASVSSFLPLLGSAARSRDYLTYAVATLALVYTHYSGFLLLAFEGVLYVASRLRGRLRAALVAVAIMTAALVPLAPYAWRTLRLRHLFAFEYRPLHLILAEAWSSFSLGLRIPVIRPFWQVAPFLALFIVGGLMLDVPRRRRACVVCLAYLLLPILLLYGFSFYSPNYMNPRHLMVVSPAWELVLAQGLATLRRRFWPGLVVILTPVLLLSGQANYDIFTAHNLWKDDIRGAVDYILERARPGDAVVLHHAVIRLTFDYYYAGPYPEIAIPRHNYPLKKAARAEFADWAQRYDRIWFLYGPPPTYFPHDFLPGWADANLFKVDQQGFEAWWTYVGVAAYDDEPPLFDTLPDGTHPLDAAYGPLRLVGFRERETMAGENAWLEFYWHAEDAGESLPSEPLRLAVRLRDEAGVVWLERADQVLPFYRPADWPADQLVQTEFWLPLPEDTPPVAFDVEVEPVGLGGVTAAGQMLVVRPAARQPAPRPQVRFDDGVEILASALAGDTFRAGYSLLGSLTWRAAGTPAADYRLRVRLTNLWGREVASGEMAPSAAGFPTSAWLPDDRVAGRFALPLPADLEGGRYRVQVGLVRGTDGTAVPVRHWYGKRDWFTLGTVRIDAWPLVTEMPDDVAHLLEDVRLAEAIRLLGYDLAYDRDLLTLTLYWQAEQPVETNYHVFVHLGTPDAPPVAQDDGVPGDWLRPTTTWRAGEVIADAHTIPLAGLEPGRYDLLVGLYDPGAGGQRPVTVVHGEVVPGGYVLLKEVEVEQ